MSPAELAKLCVDRMNEVTAIGLDMEKTPLIIVTPKGWKAPPKFPRGELLQVKENGDRVRCLKAFNVLAWLTANGFVAINNG